MKDEVSFFKFIEMRNKAFLSGEVEIDTSCNYFEILYLNVRGRLSPYEIQTACEDFLLLIKYDFFPSLRDIGVSFGEGVYKFELMSKEYLCDKSDREIKRSIFLEKLELIEEKL